MADSTAWVKIDLSNLDQTGLDSGYDIYVLGYAASSGQILQHDPTLNRLVLAPPLPGPLTVHAPKGFTQSGNTITLSTSATLLVGNTVTGPDGFQATITAISASIVTATYDGGTNVWTPFTNPTWKEGAGAAFLQAVPLNQGTVTDSGGGATLTGLPFAAGTVPLGALAVGTIPHPGESNAYFFPNTSGNPFPASGSPATVTSVTAAGSTLSVGFSQPSGQGTVALGSSFVSLFAGGTNGSLATLASTGDEAGQVTISGLYSTSEVQPANTQVVPNQIASMLVVSGVDGNVPVYQVTGYTITLSNAPPTGIASLTFATSVGGTIAGTKSFTIDATVYVGVVAALAIGQMPTLTYEGSSPVSTLSVTQLQQSGGTITVTLSGDLPGSPATGTSITVALPPTGGVVPAFKWDAKNNNAVWAQQTPGPGPLSVNGARIYFILDDSGGARVPTFGYTVTATGVSVSQPSDDAVWKGQSSPSQYMELTVDSLSSSGTGSVYVDLSAVDGFFFPAALSTSVGSSTLLMGQPWQAYQSPNQQYAAVTRTQILDAWKSFTEAGGTTFTESAAALQAAYADLLVTADKTTVGIQNPTFAWVLAKKRAAFDDTWAPALDALFSKTENTVDLVGDLPSTTRGYLASVQVTSGGTGYQNDDVVTFSAPSSGGRAATGQVVVGNETTGNIASITLTDPGNYALTDSVTIQSITSSQGSGGAGTGNLGPATMYYQGKPGKSGDIRYLQLAEYADAPLGTSFAPAYATAFSTGATFTVYDPRTVPATEPQAIGQSAGQQVFGCAGVFASTLISTGNYVAGSSGAWSTGDALVVLNAIQRDIVTALNQGIGGTLRAPDAKSAPGSTTAYWVQETNWYPYKAPFGPATPQNLYSQWVHTVVLDAGANQYFATYPFGDAGSGQDYGTPTKNASGQLMNMTYGFAYDESPAHGAPGANVPSKFLPLSNTAGSTLTFQLVFGPWGS